MARAKAAILAIDEGTSGTRAALVAPDGRVSCVNHAALDLQSPRAGVVEQDAGLLLERTVEVCRGTIAQARAAGVTILALALATQRATSVLWDTATGNALVPAMVWQDSRHAPQLRLLGKKWNRRLVAHTGRPAGIRSPYLWAAGHIAATPHVKAAFAEGRLGFGTVDTWLLWHLAEERRCVTTSTNAGPAGAYDLAGHRYLTEWLEALSFPAELLPELAQDSDELGHTRDDLLGVRVPIRASCGDQLGALVGLGCLDAGQAMCVHGTGSFVDLVIGRRAPLRPGLHEATVTTPAWRRNGVTHLAVETFAPTTGSALNWMCSGMRWFENAREIADLAATVGSAEGLCFLPALAGLRLPVVAPGCGASLTGLTMAHGRAHLARAAIEGIAHSVVSCAEASARSAGVELREIVAGGGLAASDLLLQLQADFGGVPVRRIGGAEHASLRGAAFLAGSDGLVWNDLADARATLAPGETFLPAIGEDERQARRARWQAAVEAEIGRARADRRQHADTA